MRIVIVSDIHSNLVALETVLSAVGSFDQLWNLGDTIGYGPRPNQCMESMRALASVMIAGNHDLGCIGKVDLTDFNTDAKLANLWNGEQLTDDNRAALDMLPPSTVVDDRFMVAHGSPRDPVWEYMLSRDQAAANFEVCSQQVCFIGHSHVPLIFVKTSDGQYSNPILPTAGDTLQLEDGVRYFINPGSVGQPRNQDPRSAYAILDTDAGSVRFMRIEYDIAKTQRQMREAQLPTALVRRLEFGM